MKYAVAALSAFVVPVWVGVIGASFAWADPKGWAAWRVGLIFAAVGAFLAPLTIAAVLDLWPKDKPHA